MIREKLLKGPLFLDGGMGTLLQEMGLKPGELPERWNIKEQEAVISIHRQYYEAGSDIVLTNTFGANALKFHDTDYTLESVIKRAVENAQKARKQAGVEDGEHYVALDMGPTGKLLKPMGYVSFEEAYEAFVKTVKIGEKAGADLIHIETMSDTYEVKAAVLAAKEQTNLPVFVTLIFDERGKLLTGADVPAAVAMLEGLRVDALGINCGLGPKQMLPILRELRKWTSLPIIVKPNAGLPKEKDGQTCYDVTPDAFASQMEELVQEGACIIGGCCGTTPEHIRQMVKRCREKEIIFPDQKQDTVVSSYGQAVIIGNTPIIIGERINPTGKKRLKQALKEHDMDYILKEGLKQEEQGAHILDVNVGLPDIDEASVIEEIIEELQGITSLPLQIDTVDAKALERAMRKYNGKPMVNSVSGKQESMDMVFPLVQKYGGVVVALTLDERGIPMTVEGRAEIAGKILAEAEKYGIPKKDIVIDVLSMTISSEPKSAKIVLDALEQIQKQYKVRTVLGVSNISFGLPKRPAINATFFAMAMLKGLSAGIINPGSEEMMKSYRSYLALMNLDPNCEAYIQAYAGEKEQETTSVREENLKEQESTLGYVIEKGLKEEAVYQTKQLLETKEPLEIIDTYLIPALDKVGKGFEKGTVFLPQLLMSADAAKEAFAVIKERMQAGKIEEKKKEKIILATVKGDIHDIGKNIVKVLLENYGFQVLDLGKDVPPEKIVETAVKEQVKLVGLSALMTTTVVSMEETIRQLKETHPDCKIMVGGAVLNQEYADRIKADFYGKDAMQSVYYAQEVLNG
nr:homocysteine S-methyltransferase family protein [uncultured Sellimonas sp.]